MTTEQELRCVLSDLCYQAREREDEIERLERKIDYWRDKARAAPTPPSVPDGWVLVPVDPTMDMMHAGEMNWDYGDKATRDIWRDMLAAALKPGDE